MPETRVTRRMPPPVDPALFADVAQLQVDVSAAQSTADDAQAEAGDAMQEALARRPNISQFSEDGTWNKPDGALIVFVRVRGSGATGEAFAMFLPSELGATETVTVATGAGGDITTSFGTHASAIGIVGDPGHALVVSL